MKRAGKRLKSLASEIDPKLFMQENSPLKEESPFKKDIPSKKATLPADETPLAVALKLLNSRDYTSRKLCDILNAKGLSGREIEDCIARLEAWGYLNDREYGIRRLEILLKKLKSRLFIREDLIRQGLSEGLVDCLMEEIYPEEDEIQIAGKFLEKRSKIKRKSQFWGVRLLQQAGFSENTIHKCFPE